MFKSRIQKIREMLSSISKEKHSDGINPKGMRRFELNNSILSRMTYKRLIQYTIITNTIALMYYLFKYNDKSYNLSFTRWLSRKVGWLTRVELPKFLRKHVFDIYCNFYNVNREDILDPNFENYKSVNDFFIRKIKMEKRVPQTNDNSVLTSPCDGTVYSISKVKDINHLFIVKKINYLMSNFLYGSDDFVFEMNNITKKKHVYQMTIYLSPGDCHRYFSPGEILVEKRVYIPGFLEPVKPSYITKHPNVFQTNERVTLQCKFAHLPDSLLYISFVGALNVGSVSINFDQLFKTNEKIKSKDKDNISGRAFNYKELSADYVRSTEKIKNIYFKPKVPLILKELEKDLDENDIRDIINIDDLEVSPDKPKELAILDKIESLHDDLFYNYSNNFYEYHLSIHKLKNKLKNPSKIGFEDYKITKDGILLDRNEEIGCFNFGSTIVLIFSIDKEVEFKVNVGDKVKIGQQLYDYVNKI